MIHKITIENFYSIRERQVLDLRLPKTTPDMPRFRPSPSDPSIRLPTVVAFFGPNASGKSTVLRALASVVDFAARSFEFPPNAPLWFFQPFRAEGWWDKPSRITVEFDATWQGGNTPALYRYDLAVEHGLRTGHKVAQESLEIFSRKRFRRLFHREGDRTRCAGELGITANDARLDAVRPNASIISTLAQFNHPFFRTAQFEIDQIVKNIVGHQLLTAEQQEVLEYFHQNAEARSRLVHELQRLDLGIVDMRVVVGPNGLNAVFEHQGLGQPVRLDEESQGTRHFLAMFPAVFHTLRTGSIAVVDEFDINLHPHSSVEIMRWFHSLEVNSGRAQLFLAAHSPSILDELEKEEVYLVEKERDGSTKLVPLRHFHGLRRDPSIARKYLGGAFGALPNIG